MSRRRAATASGAVAAALVLAACADPPRSAPPEPPVSGELRQFRGGAAQRVLQVTLRVRTAVSVVSARVDAQGFADGPRNDAAVDLPAGAVTDLPVRYGRADCGAEPGSARATLGVREAGTTRELVVPLADRGLLARLHAAECAERALAEQVRFGVTVTGPPRRLDGRPALPVLLSVTRLRPGERVVVQELGRHIVFAVRPESPATPLLVLGPEQASAELPLTLAPSRCDGHALAENKRAGLLGVYAGLGDADVRLVTVVPDPATQARLADFAVEGCRAS